MVQLQKFCFELHVVSLQVKKWVKAEYEAHNFVF